MATDEVQEAAARRQNVFRAVNERVKELVEIDPAVFLCECVDVECIEEIELPLAEYERIRGMSTCFLVKPGHVLPDAERVAESTDTYSVVEKIGTAAAVAVRLDAGRR